MNRLLNWRFDPDYIVLSYHWTCFIDLLLHIASYITSSLTALLDDFITVSTQTNSHTYLIFFKQFESFSYFKVSKSIIQVAYYTIYPFKYRVKFFLSHTPRCMIKHMLVMYRRICFLAHVWLCQISRLNFGQMVFRCKTLRVPDQNGIHGKHSNNQMTGMLNK